jgi:hypothetical protein
MEHRLVFFMHHGRWPSVTDHVNGVRDDNRIDNLRECSHIQNAYNARGKGTRDLPKGVHYHKKRGKYVAYVSVNGKRINVGEFNTADAAVAAVEHKRTEFHGEFVKHQ